MPIDPRQALSDNVSWLLENTDDTSQAKLAKRAGLDQKTISRMVRKANATTLASIEAVAGVAKVDSWQMLVPSFGEGLHTLRGTTIAPVDRPQGLPRRGPAAGKDDLGLPVFRGPEPPPTGAPSPTATTGPRGGKRSSGSAPKSGAHVKR